jgi:predicted enzyme related to lactoylglutathione lyase
MVKATNAFSGFSVDDIDRAKDFYGRVLGLDASVGEMGVLDIKLGNGATVMAYPKQDHQPATYTMLNFVVDDIESAVDELSAAGVAFEKYDMPEIKTDSRGIARSPGGEGPTMAWFKDPAGNILGLIQE